MTVKPKYGSVVGVRCYRSRGGRRLVESALPDKVNMLRLAHECGFELRAVNADGVLLLLLLLRTE